jgi:hypothetical protein
MNAPVGTKFVIDRIADGEVSTGFTWHIEVDGVEGIGLRGTIYVALSDEGKIKYVREVNEPLSKPGGAIAQLLKAVAESNAAKESIEAKDAKKARNFSESSFNGSSESI